MSDREQGHERDTPRFYADYRLPKGHHGLPAAEVAEIQRWRLIAAAAEVLAKQGYMRTTSKSVSRHAGVSSSAFYEYFRHLDACLLAGYEVAADCVWDLASAACTGEGEWPGRLGVAVAAAIDYALSEPPFAHLLGAEASASMAPIAAARERLVERLAGLLCSGRQLCVGVADGLPPGIELYLVSGAIAFACDRLAAGDLDQLREAIPQLVEILALPYHEPAAGRRP
jgi:AcrR family transcriptional regulator